MKLGKLFGSSKITRMMFASDFHGSDTVFRKFLSAALQYNANYLVVGGDITGKAMTPIVNEGNGTYVGYMYGRKEEAHDPEELARVKNTMSSVGFYPIVLEKDEAEELEKDKEKMAARFECEMKERVREWLTLAEETLTPKNIKLFFMPGNDDLPSIDDVIDQFPNVVNPDMNHIVLEDCYELVGLSNSNMTPWACERDVEEPELVDKLAQLEKTIANPDCTIAVIHVPPVGSGLDTCPELDENLKIVTLGGQVKMISAGSTAVRSFIERVQPMLTLHGHIHESPGHVRIGKTLAINPGSEYAEGILKTAIINLEGGKVKGHLLISG
jgi:Icc-related predicted phosphoesterase